MPADTLDIEEDSRSVSADRAGAVLENSIEVKPGSLTPELVIWRSVYLAFFSAVGMSPLVHEARRNAP